MDTLRWMRDHNGRPVAVADNDSAKWGKNLETVPIVSVEEAVRQYSGARFIVTLYGQESRQAVTAQLKLLGVTADVPLIGMEPPAVLDRYLLPDPSLYRTIRALVNERVTMEVLRDQIKYRECAMRGGRHKQPPPSPLAGIYFPSFIAHRDDEVFVDCGADYGDSVQAFMARHPVYKHIVAFEPDATNFAKLCLTVPYQDKPHAYHRSAVGDVDGRIPFRSNGDYSSNASPTAVQTQVRSTRLDSVHWPAPPTFIKMDIEGFEQQALWGGRRVIQAYRPVLAVCAYHHPADLWEIPQLVHMMVPEYELRLRRYAEGWLELVWYAVPKERLVTGV